MKTFEVPPTSKETLEAQAQAVLKKFDPKILESPRALNVERLLDLFMAKEYGWRLDTQEKGMLPHDVEALSNPVTKTVVLPEDTYNTLSYDGRSRFTGCHEFSHVCLHRHVMNMRMSAFDEKTAHMYRKSRREIPAYKCAEWQADHFASALLMPMPTAMKLFESVGWNIAKAINEFQRVFCVSFTAARIRVEYLNKKRAARWT